MEIGYYIRRSEIGINILPNIGTKFTKEERFFLIKELRNAGLLVSHCVSGLNVTSTEHQTLRELSNQVENSIPKKLTKIQTQSFHRMQFRKSASESETYIDTNHELESFIAEFFGYMNPINKLAMCKFLTGETDKFAGVLSREGNMKMLQAHFTKQNSHSEREMDFIALRNYYNDSNLRTDS